MRRLALLLLLCGCVGGSPTEPGAFDCVDSTHWTTLHKVKGGYLLVTDSVTKKPCPFIRPIRR